MHHKTCLVIVTGDTLYSLLVVDLTLPASVSIPDVGERYFSLSMLSGEHDTFKQLFAGNHTLTKDDCGCEPPCRQTNGQLWSTYKFHSASCKEPASEREKARGSRWLVACAGTAFGTRYAVVLGRMYYQQGNETDLAIAHSLQDGLTIEQEGDTSLLTWEPPAWDMADLMHIRGLLKELKVGSTEPVVYGHFNGADKVDHLHGLLNVAAAWGGPHGPTDQFYVLWTPPDDRAQYIITIGDVPIIENGFWSITVYSREGYLFDEKGTYQWTREKGSPTTVILGDCEHVAIPCVTTHPGWNIALRIFRPASSVISGDFKMPMPVLFKR